MRNTLASVLALTIAIVALPAVAQQFQAGGQMMMGGAGQIGGAQMMTVPAPQTMGNPANQAQQSREGQVADDQAPYNAGCGGGQMRRINRDGFTIEGAAGGSHN